MKIPGSLPHMPFPETNRKAGAARHRLAAMASAVQTGLRKCRCLALALGSHRQRSYRGPAAGNAGVGQREMPPAVAAPSTQRLGERKSRSFAEFVASVRGEELYPDATECESASVRP